MILISFNQTKCRWYTFERVKNLKNPSQSQLHQQALKKFGLPRWTNKEAKSIDYPHLT